MRSLSLLLPLILLAAIWMVPGKREEVPLVERESVGQPRLVWVSHDWIEELPRDEGEGQLTRKETFGMDRVLNEDAQCVDPNCRACLIDLVYGREF